jgi:hypothetical protein
VLCLHGNFFFLGGGGGLGGPFRIMNESGEGPFRIMDYGSMGICCILEGVYILDHFCCLIDFELCESDC